MQTAALADRETAISASISLRDTAQIARFGEDAQRQVAGFADQILQQARGRDLGDSGALLSDLMVKAKGLDVADLRKTGLLGHIVGDARRHLLKFRARFETVSSQIDHISGELARRVDRMQSDLEMLDGLHSQARASVEQLSAYIDAGKAYAEAFKARELAALEAASKAADPANQTAGLLAAQEYQEAVQALDRLEKRVATLQQARQIAIQQLPQIRIVQSGDATLIESLGASINLTIPAWKQKMAMLLGLQRQQEALSLQKAVTDATNTLLRHSSEMMKTQALEIEQQSQRGLVDIDTLAQTNQDLIDTLTGVLQLQAEGRARRAEAERAMERQTQDLHLALAQSEPKRAAA